MVLLPKNVFQMSNQICFSPLNEPIMLYQCFVQSVSELSQK